MTTHNLQVNPEKMTPFTRTQVRKPLPASFRRPRRRPGLVQGFGVWGFRVLWVWVSGFQGLGFQGFRVQGFGVQGLGLGVQGECGLTEENSYYCIGLLTIVGIPQSSLFRSLRLLFQVFRMTVQGFQESLVWPGLHVFTCGACKHGFAKDQSFR